MILYKLTDSECYTRRSKINETCWIPGIQVEVVWGFELCASGCIHAYTSPLVAVCMDPIYGGFLPGGRMWEAEGLPRLNDGMKVGANRLTLLREIEVPELSIAVRVRAAIYCVLEVIRRSKTRMPKWEQWADAWVAGRRDAGEAQKAALDIVPMKHGTTIEDRGILWAAEVTALAAEMAANSNFETLWFIARAVRASVGAMKKVSDGDKLLHLDEIIRRAIADDGRR